MVTDSPTLFDITRICFHCSDLGIEVDSHGVVSRCWRLRAGGAHRDPGPAAAMLARSLHSLYRERQPIDLHTLNVAKTLMAHTSAKPCERERLLDLHFTWCGSSALRKFHSAIETLRSQWLLPVGSRKEKPSGYWIITEIDDFAEWVGRAKSAPITQLTTIHRVAKRNFPVFAEQMEFDFWNDNDPQPFKAAA